LRSTPIVLLLIPLLAGAAWSEDAGRDLTGSDDPNPLTLSGNMTVTATFARNDSIYGWVELTTAAQPPPRYYHAMAYGGEDRVVLFGGRQSGTRAVNLDDTWVFDLSENTWTEISTDPHPSKRNRHDMCYIGGDQVILFGGYDASASNETWIYDLSESTWTQVYPDTLPPTHSGQRMVYAGDDQAITSLWLMWAYDLSENSWTPLEPSPAPANRDYYGMARVGGDQAIIYSGYWFVDDDTWLYDLSENAWTPISTPAQPSPRHYPGMAYLHDDQALCFGGEVVGGAEDDTWVFDLSEMTWTELAPGTHPSARIEHDAAHIGDGQVLMFGGRNASHTQEFNDTWLFSLTQAVDDPPREVRDLRIVNAHGMAGVGSKDLRLIWSAVTADTSGAPITIDAYVIYRDTIPDFMPDSTRELVITADTTHLDVDAGGDAAVNYFYFVNARKDGMESFNSKCVGEFGRNLVSESK
jgi:hypothetical protein